jgi:hypothetical protein
MATGHHQGKNYGEEKFASLLLQQGKHLEKLLNFWTQQNKVLVDWCEQQFFSYFA